MTYLCDEPLSTHTDHRERVIFRSGPHTRRGYVGLGEIILRIMGGRYGWWDYLQVLGQNVAHSAMYKVRCANDSYGTAFQQNGSGRRIIKQWVRKVA